MANNEFTIPIPARLKNVAKGGHVAGAKDIIDDNLGKKQSEINREVSEAIEGNTQAVTAERQRAVAAEGALDNRLSDIEELAEISIDGGEAKIATGEDFHNPTAEQRAKIPTVGAILDGADDEPTGGSGNLVKSGGIKNELALGAVYDVSAKNPTAGPNNDGKFESLSALLSDSNLNTLIPTSVRRGGMSIKFVQSSDNKYVQFRLMLDEFTIDTNYWSVACENILVDDPEFVVLALDADRKMLVGIRKADGKVWYGAGVPPQVVDYIEKVVANLHIENKVDKETGKSLIDAVFASIQSFTNDHEYLRVATDSADKFLAGFRMDNGKLDLPTQKIPDLIADEKSLSVDADKEGKVINETFKDGSVAHYTGHTFLKEVSLKKGLILPDGTAFDSLHNNSIERLYNKYEYAAILDNISRTPVVNDERGNHHADYQRVVFLHYSDIHRAVANNKRIMEFYRLYRTYITDVVLTGDIAEGDYTDYDDNFEVDDDYKNKVLKVIGNHDVYYPSQPGKICTPQAAYEKFFKGIENWGVNYTANKCYYYKDYPNANLRLIVIDIMRLVSPWDWGYSTDDQEQLDWLTDTLESARQAGYSVIISAHWVPSLTETTERLETSFDDKDISAAFENHGSNELLSIVDTFINNGGEFVCWMVGHRHADLVGTAKAEGSDNKQLYVVVECAISRDNWSNYYRGSGTKAFDCFNLMSVDTFEKIITIYRIGAEFNNLLQHKVSISIDYKNKSLIK